MRETTLGFVLILSAAGLWGCTAPRAGGGVGRGPEGSPPVASAPDSARRSKPAPGPGRAGPSAPAPLVSNRYAVKVHRAPFFFYGPSQPNGPDLGLVKGSKVTMVKPDRLFSKVRTDFGHVGYIATDYLEELPPEPPPMRARALSLSEGEMPAFYRNLSRKPLPEMKVVPVELMIQAEPPLPTDSETKPGTLPEPAAPPTATETLIPTSTTTEPLPTPAAP